MLEFCANNPFPEICFEEVSYSEILRHSQAVDAWLGFKFEKIESLLYANGSRQKPSHSSEEHQQLWFGLAAQSLLTPYVEIRAMLKRLNLGPGQRVVDLGAAYGRMAFVLMRIHPGVHFVGYEYVGERVREAQRVLDISRPSAQLDAKIEIIHADLAATNFQPVPADVYFIYDFGTPKAIEKTLYDLKKIAQSHPDQSAPLLVARGRHSRMLIESRHGWLKKLFVSEPEGRATIYRMDLGCDKPFVKRKRGHESQVSEREFISATR